MEISQATDDLSKSGIVIKIKEKVLFVSINCASSCSSCHAKEGCTSLDQSEKIIEVAVPNPLNYRLGEKVNVTMPLKMGFLALFYGILTPLIIILVALLIGNKILLNDIYTALISLFLLALYYFTLYLNQSALKKRFFFKVEKIGVN